MTAPSRQRPKAPPRFHKTLLSWFDRHARSMPWRQSRDAYRIWLSEVMLQQTTVAAVIPYYERFLARFPTVADLATADLNEVLALWAGLGYYSRARNLHAAAKRIHEEHNGVFPADPAVWAALPGVGRYIAAAVLSQAFETRLGVVEANTKRLYARLFAYRGDLKTTASQAWLWETAQALVPATRVGDFNQALMELGATICTPKAPACGRCPLRANCQSAQQDLQNDIPAKSLKPAISHRQSVALIVTRGGQFLMRERPAPGRWAGLWEFVYTEANDAETTPAACARLQALFAPQNLDLQELGTIHHPVTRYRFAMTVLTTALPTETMAPTGYDWQPPEALTRLPLSTPMKKALSLYQRDSCHGLFS
jgi:A/G-specific adenine glycosylase